jgi:hypothetical protein
MSTVLVVAPIVVANWSVITAAVSAAISVSGFTMIQHESANLSTSTKTKEVIDVDNSEILTNAAGTDESIVVQRDGVTATFQRDPTGGLQLCMEGNHVSKSQLRAIGEELLGRVTQQYAYHRIVTELKNRGMQIVDEEVTETESVKIRVRNW